MTYVTNHYQKGGCNTIFLPIRKCNPNHSFSYPKPIFKGYRLAYDPRAAAYDPRRPPYNPTYDPRTQIPQTRRGIPPTPLPAQGSRFYVVKRKRNPNSSFNRRAEEENEIEGATSSVNYQTAKTFHREATLDNGERHGEYGYIDPIGVRRVVTYTTGPRGGSNTGSVGGIAKGKENDYVGPHTYFQAN